MNSITLVEILTVLFLVMVFYKMKLIKPITGYREEVFSTEVRTAFRGVLASVVLLHHVAQLSSPTFMGDCYLKYAYVVVGAFFFLSGYGVMISHIKSSNYKKRFLTVRIPSILIPYLVMNLVYWILFACKGRKMTFQEVIASYMSGNPIVYYSWFIVVILIFYLVFAMMMFLFRDHHLLMIIGAALWWCLHVVLCRKLGFYECWYNTAHVLVLGMVVAKYEGAIRRVIEKAYWFFLLLFFALYVFVQYFQGLAVKLIPLSNNYFILTLCCSIFFICFLYVFHMKVQIGNKVSTYLGKISLEIYLCQGGVLYTLTSLHEKVGNEMLWCLIVLCTTLVTAQVFHWLFSVTKKKR